MIYFLFLISLIILTFGIISVLSFIAGEKHLSEKKQEIHVINGDLIQKVKSEYLKFLLAVSKNNTKYLKLKCSADLFKKIDKKKKITEKILCIINTNIISFDGSYLQVEFISRSINTEIIKDICRLKILNNKIIFDQFVL